MDNPATLSLLDALYNQLVKFFFQVKNKLVKIICKVNEKSVNKVAKSVPLTNINAKNCQNSKKTANFAVANRRPRSGARVVEEARLESVYTPKGYRGFESPSLR